MPCSGEHMPVSGRAVGEAVALGAAVPVGASVAVSVAAGDGTAAVLAPVATSAGDGAAQPARIRISIISRMRGHIRAEKSRPGILLGGLAGKKFQAALVDHAQVVIAQAGFQPECF